MSDHPDRPDGQVAPTTDPPGAPTTVPAEPRQRWRLVLATDGLDAGSRDSAALWRSTVEAAGLPLAWSEGARQRPRISIGAPLPTGMAAHGELVDIVVTARWPAWRVREALVPVLPAGWRLVDLHDVWLAGPPLAGRVVAADYRIELGGDPPVERLDEAARALLAVRSVPRERAKGDRMVAYDLRPLVADLRVEPGPPPSVVARTRFHPELGTGRPEEVVAALGDRAGVPLDITAVVRERLVLAEGAD